MARSTYVYVVQDAAGVLVTAFTVKHELARWLDARGPAQPLVTRVHDGGHWSDKGPVQLNPQTLEAAP